jgi:hypothetical protein
MSVFSTVNSNPIRSANASMPEVSCFLQPRSSITAITSNFVYEKTLIELHRFHQQEGILAAGNADADPVPVLII